MFPNFTYSPVLLRQMVKSLYDLDAEHNKSLTGKKYIFCESGDYVDTSYLFYNDCLASISSKYACLQNTYNVVFVNFSSFAL